MSVFFLPVHTQGIYGIKKNQLHVYVSESITRLKIYSNKVAVLMNNYSTNEKSFKYICVYFEINQLDENKKKFVR